MDQRHFRQLTKELGVTIQERQEICRILQEDGMFLLLYLLSNVNK